MIGFLTLFVVLKVFGKYEKDIQKTITELRGQLEPTGNEIQALSASLRLTVEEVS